MANGYYRRIGVSESGMAAQRSAAYSSWRSSRRWRNGSRRSLNTMASQPQCGVSNGHQSQLSYQLLMASQL